ncbi:MAG: hypothetical protein A3D94_22935 [Alphaproteobacteria bacterium RIFCSPHIGHO2_12_FULL_66_14]|jgi:hypothetical protein|nr:MAG: hypothetical protein A3D94_22935 [Alphaproteobacteria bacterium RIFCSPHIGHO2_12_FULL_66_14]
MPIHLDISPLHRVVVIVASGHVTPEEISRTTQDLVKANVPSYGKIIDVAMSTSDLSEAQVEGIAAMLRGDPGSGRGPVAFVINPDRVGFAHAFADVTKGERPVQLFRSLREAREWLAQQPGAPGR